MRRSPRLRFAPLVVLVAVVLVGGLGAGGSPLQVAAPVAEPGPLAPLPAPTPMVEEAIVADVPPVRVSDGPVAQPGCPAPPRPKSDKPAPGLPKGVTLVPEDQVPAPLPPPTTRTADGSVVGGRGMYLWQWARTEGGDLGAVVRRAKAAGLSTLWVRVGDSKNGFYGAKYLDGLVPLAHREGIKVVGWGFPFLGDPAADAAWSTQVLAWQKDGHRLDAFSPDLEQGSEGVVVTDKRIATYLGLTRPALGGRPLVATVYNPTDLQWGKYPYALVASYADVMAPMVYWGCRDPGADVQRAVSRLATFGLPVAPAGQAYDMAADGGRRGNPTGSETVRFLRQAQTSGAVGVSFWVWQASSDEQWQAISAYRW